MSLDVSPALLEKAQTGNVREEEFLACIHESLPYAWQLIADLARQLRSGEEQFVDLMSRRADNCSASWPATPCAMPWNGIMG